MRKLDQMASGSVIVAALMVIASTARRELSPDAGPRVGLAEPQPPVYIQGWEKTLLDGIWSGPESAPVKIVEFADLECPFCMRFHRALADARTRYRNELAFVFHHYPLSTHRFAMPAARAAECAHAQGNFAEFLDAVYEKQDSLGLRTWLDYARAAGIRDTVAFVTCNRNRDSVQRIQAGLELGAEIGVVATPTVIINGWRFGIPPYENLVETIEAIRTGEAPYRRSPK